MPRSTVKRVVVTSSFVTMLQYRPVQHNETHWNDAILQLVKEPGEQEEIKLYAASKTLAEKAVWEFMENNKGKITFDLVI